jgi:hypothetical protein
MTTTDMRDRSQPATVPASALSTPRVVVAVDRRPASRNALAWAADEALCRGMSLRIVTAFADPDRPHAPRTVEEAMVLQRRLHRQLEQSRPWIEDAELIVRRGGVLALFADASCRGDILVVGEAADVGAMQPAHRPLCPVVIVPAAPADG